MRAQTRLCSERAGLCCPLEARRGKARRRLRVSLPLLRLLWRVAATRFVSTVKTWGIGQSEGCQLQVVLPRKSSLTRITEQTVNKNNSKKMNRKKGESSLASRLSSTGLPGSPTPRGAPLPLYLFLDARSRPECQSAPHSPLFTSLPLLLSTASRTIT